MFCHPGYSARRNYVKCNSASVTCDIFKGVLNWKCFCCFTPYAAGSVAWVLLHV